MIRYSCIIVSVYVGGHWTPQLISMAGGDHPLNRAPAIDDGAAKSFPVCIQQIIDSNPDWIIIAPCGLNLESATREAKLLLAKNEGLLRLQAVREGRIVAVDGDAMFNRPGVRLVECLEWLVYLFHKDTHPLAAKLCPKNFPFQYIDAHDF